MYEYHNNILSIPARLLYEDWGLMSYDSYKKNCLRKKLIRTKEGKGCGNRAWVSVPDLPQNIKAICLEKIGKPEDVLVVNLLEPYVQPDTAAAVFFSGHRKPEGGALPVQQQRQKVINCCILNAIQRILKEKGLSGKIFGKRKLSVWENLSDAVNKLEASKWSHNLPVAPKRLKEKYESYVKQGYHVFIHKGEGNQNTAKIKGAAADFILANYALPIKLTVPMVLGRYLEQRLEKGWPELTEGAIYNWLYSPERERIWTLSRHGKQAWQQKYQHSLRRDKSNWFPNVYWAIDGTKLDWIHFEEAAANKMAAKLRINVLFDIYSEKIIGWSLSETEDHADHFRAIKMAIKTSGCRPYLLTYDSQSGHKMTRMQELYSSLVAEQGGLHHVHRVGAKNNPAEQLFNRFQQQVITKFWFSDGQGVRVKREDHQPNTDFISAHKYLLKTKTELLLAWETAVNQWNAAQHPHYDKARNEVYQHPMQIREELGLEDVMKYLWIEESKKAITYKKDGLSISVGKQLYQYEVYDENKAIDIEFRRKNIGKKFLVRYDPDAMDVYIQLFEVNAKGDKIFVTYAEPKRKHIDIPVLMKAGDKERWMKDYTVRDQELIRDRKALEALLQRTGITAQTCIDEQELSIKFKGSVPKALSQKIEAEEDDILFRM